MSLSLDAFLKEFYVAINCSMINKNIEENPIEISKSWCSLPCLQCIMSPSIKPSVYGENIVLAKSR